MITVRHGLMDITFYVVQIQNTQGWWDVSIHDDVPFSKWREHDNRVEIFGLDDTLAFDNKDDAFSFIREVGKNKKNSLRLVSRRFVITETVVVEDSVIEEIKERLRAYYSEDEVVQWLAAPQPLLDGQIANDLIARGEADKIHNLIDQLDTGVYL